MTKNEIIRRAAFNAGISLKDEQEAVDAFLCAISDILEEEEDVIIPDFGKFIVKQCAERRVLNPQTGEPIVIPAQKRVRFRPYGNITNYSQKYRL